MQDRIKIKEAIIVEGRDDAIEVAKAYDTLIIATHGYGITRDTWKLIGKAHDEKGIVVLTDPDFSGREIRRKITERFPDAKQAYMPLDKARRDGDIGIENSSTEDIIAAVTKAHVVATDEPTDPLTQDDLRACGLEAGAGAKALRDAVSAELGIGYGNGKAFLKRLNDFGITRDELEKAVSGACKEQQA